MVTPYKRALVYTCAICKGTFYSDRPEEDALDELKENFGDIPVDECSALCEDCYKKMMSLKEEEKC